MPHLLHFKVLHSKFLDSKAVRTSLILLFWLLMVLLRVVHLDSDAYARLSWSSALLTDEGFYIHNARNLLLFGHMRTDEFNNALIMPLLHCVQVAVFTLCGVGAIQARMISVVTGLLSLLVFFAAMRRAFGLRAAWLTLALLGLDPVFALHNRLALMDTPACLPLCCAFYAWTRFFAEDRETGRQGDRETRRQGDREIGRQGDREKLNTTEETEKSINLVPSPRRPVSLSPYLPVFFCGLSLGAAYSARGLAAVIVPVPVLLLLTRAYRESKYATEGAGKAYLRFVPLLAFVAGLTLAMLLYLLLWHAPNHQELARVNAHYLRVQLMPHTVREWTRNVARGLWHWQRGMLPYLLRHSPVLLLSVVLRVWQIRGRQGKGTGSSSGDLTCELYLWGWLLMVVALTLSVNYAPSRYYVLFYPPLAGLAALYLNNVLDDNLQDKQDKRVREVKPLKFRDFRMILWLFGVIWSVGNGYWYADWLLHLSYRQRDADRWLASHLPPGSVLIGAMAPGLSLDNRFQCVNVIEGLCNDKHPVEKAAPAPRYIVILDQTPLPTPASNAVYKWANRWKEPYWSRSYPELVRPERRLMAFPGLLRPFFTVGVYPVPDNYTDSGQTQAK